MFLLFVVVVVVECLMVLLVVCFCWCCWLPCWFSSYVVVDVRSSSLFVVCCGLLIGVCCRLL